MLKQTPMIEDLESRNLFSVMPLMTYAHAQPSSNDAVHAELNVAAVKAKTPAKKPPSVLGTWTGRYTVKAFPFKLKYDLDLNFDDVGKATANGTLTVDDDNDYSGRWTGYTQKVGYFSYTLKKHGNKITITGTLNAKSTYAWGTINVDWGWRSSRGDFTLTKIS